MKFITQNNLFNCGPIALYNAFIYLNMKAPVIKYLQKKLKCNHMYGTQETDIHKYVKKEIDPSSKLLVIKDINQIDNLLKDNILIILHYSWNKRHTQLTEDAHYFLLINDNKKYKAINYTHPDCQRLIDRLSDLHIWKKQKIISRKELSYLINTRNEEYLPLAITIKK